MNPNGDAAIAIIMACFQENGAAGNFHTCTASFLLERSCGHDRDKLFQQRAYGVFSIENTIRQRLAAGDRNDADVRTDEMHLRQDGTAITGSYQRKESLQIVADAGGLRRDMLRDAVLHLRCLEWNGIRIADHHILQIQFFFCQLCPAGVRVGIRNDAAQRDLEQLLIDDVVFQRNSIIYDATVDLLKLVMKAFITSPSDTFRAPYDKKADTYPRLTSFGAITDSDQFLKEENSRRYWTIEAEDIDLDTLTGINFDAVWAEAMALYRLLGSLSFRLTAAERSALARENRSFQIVRDEEALLRDMLDWSQPRDQWRELTASAICNLLGVGGRLSPVKIGRVLRKIGYSEDSTEFPLRGRSRRPKYLVPCCAFWGSPQIEIK